jgi:hypothetical protein
VLVSQLQRFGANRVVMGHTTTLGTVRPRFGGKAIFIDVGLSKTYGGRLACLLIEDDRFYALHRGEKIPLPGGDENLLSYYKKAASLDPQPSPLNELVTYFSSAQETTDPPINFGRSFVTPRPAGTPPQ